MDVALEPKQAVIIADDSRVVRKIIHDICTGTSWSLDIHQAKDGTEAHELLSSVDAAICFLDIQMPGMNGLEALAHARRQGNKIIAVIMSATEGHALRNAATELGAYDYLVKPFPPEKVRGLLDMALTRQKSLNALIVDDSALVRRILRQHVQELHPEMSVDEVGSALDAVRLVRSAIFDVILLDVHMPGLDGITALPMIRKASPRSRVIIVTAMADKETVIAAKRAGAHGILVKPINATRLANVLKPVLQGEVPPFDGKKATG